MKKTFLFLCIACSLFIMVSTSCNRAIVDTSYKFDRAIISLPNGEVVEGEVEKWIDFENSDMMQIKIDGDWYLTHVTNVCLIKEE